jgi:putative transposase
VLKVSHSGYYAWYKRPISNRARADQRLLNDIKRIHRESREAYGSLKTWKALNYQGIVCGKHRIARLRRRNCIEAKRKRRFKVTTDSRNTQWIAPNLLNRRFKADYPDQIWVGDVTYIATRSGWLYLAILLDLYSRKVIGWSMANNINKTLALGALDMALMRRKPQSKVLHHTDQGAIYGSDEYIKKIKAHQLIPSMSRKGDCYDNAIAESYFSTLKNELILGRVYQSREQARSEIFNYIEVFYNRQRLHQSLNYLTPQEYEMQTVTK